MRAQKKTIACILPPLVISVIALLAVCAWLYGKACRRFSKFPISYGNLRFNRIELDAGEVFEDDTYAFDFKFKNITQKNITITKTRTTCSCSHVNVSPQVVAPGCIGTLQGIITFSGKNGRVEESTLMQTADGYQYALKLRANVRNHYAVIPPQLDFGNVWWDDQLEGSVTINSHNPSDFNELLSIAPGHHRSILPQLRSVTDKTWRLEIKVDHPEPGLLRQYVKVKTTNPRQRSLFVPIRANIRKPIDVKPRRLFLGTISSQQVVPCKLLITRRPGFKTEITKISTSNIAIVTDIPVTFAENTANVELELTFSEIHGLVEDNLVIETSLPRFVAYIPIVAFVQH